MTNLEPRRIARDVQITTRSVGADEETPGLLKDETDLAETEGEVLGPLKRHNIASGGHVGRLLLLGSHGCKQLITFLDAGVKILFEVKVTETELTHYQSFVLLV